MKKITHISFYPNRVVPVEESAKLLVDFSDGTQEHITEATDISNMDETIKKICELLL